MTPSELEAMVRNLNTRTTAIEQILPTLVTKDDLKKGLDRVETRIDGLKSHMLTLHEETRGDYDTLARHLADVPTEIRELREKVAVIPEMRDDIRRLTKQGAGLKGDIRQLAESLARMSQDLGDRLAQLSQKIDRRPRRS